MVTPMKKLKVFEGFSGFGGMSFALKELGMPFEVVGFSEIDKYAIQCYEQNHSGKNFGSITEIDPKDIPDFDIFTGGFPCQTFSLAGNRKGELDPRGTLVWDIIRICEAKQPMYIFLENVKGFTSEEFKPTFDKVISELERIGYVVDWKILNTKDFGVPQNRERIFFIAKRRDSFKVPIFYSEFLKSKWSFKWPQPIRLKLSLRDVLETTVDEKYYIKNEKFNNIINSSYASRRELFQGEKNVSSCLMSRDYKEPKIVQVNEDNNYIDKRVYATNGISPAMNCYQNNDVKIVEEDSGVIESKKEEPILISSLQEHNTIRNDGISNCLPSAMGLGGGHTPMIVENNKSQKVINPLKDKTENGWHFEQEVHDPNGIARSVKAGGGSGNIPKVVETIGNYSPSNHDASRIVNADNIAPTVKENHGTVTAIMEDSKITKTNRLFGIYDKPDKIHQLGSVYDKNGTSPTLNTMQGGNHQPLIITNKEDFVSVAVRDKNRSIHQSTGKSYGDYPKEYELSEKKDNTSYTVKSSTQEFMVKNKNTKRIRKLTPKECFRLQGFLKDQIKLDGISASQQYKLAGNGWSINVIAEILKSIPFHEDFETQ